jgi:hypothetical protein
VPKTTIWRRLRTNALAPVPKPLKTNLSSTPTNNPQKESEDFATYVIDGHSLKFVSEDDAMSMGSSHYIVLSGNEADTLPENLQVMLPQVYIIFITFPPCLYWPCLWTLNNILIRALIFCFQNEGGVVCEVEELANQVDMETECAVGVSGESKS